MKLRSLLAPLLLLGLSACPAGDSTPADLTIPIDLATPADASTGGEGGVPADLSGAVDMAGTIDMAGDLAGRDAATPDLSPVPEGGVRTNLRVVASNLSTGNLQSYDPGEGLRILQGLKPDVVLMQEFNFGDNSDTALRTMVTANFGAGFSFFREPRTATVRIPNGVISRYPILASEVWDDPDSPDREVAVSRIDVPGPKDLWAISVHLLTRDSATRDRQASFLVTKIKAVVPAGDYLVIGGDFNTDNNAEPCLTTLAQVVVTNLMNAPQPVDNNGKAGTNASRAKPYDWVLADGDLNPLRVPVRIGAASFPAGLVFDSRVYTPLADVAPVQQGDSGAVNMQHMAVVKDFLLPN